MSFIASCAPVPPLEPLDLLIVEPPLCRYLGDCPAIGTGDSPFLPIKTWKLSAGKEKAYFVPRHLFCIEALSMKHVQYQMVAPVGSFMLFLSFAHEWEVDNNATESKYPK